MPPHRAARGAARTAPLPSPPYKVDTSRPSPRTNWTLEQAPGEEFGGAVLQDPDLAAGGEWGPPEGAGWDEASDARAQRPEGGNSWGLSELGGRAVA